MRRREESSREGKAGRELAEMEERGGRTQWLREGRETAERWYGGRG